MNQVQDELMHYGVLGMKWGKRKPEVSKPSNLKTKEDVFNAYIKNTYGYKGQSNKHVNAYMEDYMKEEDRFRTEAKGKHAIELKKLQDECDEAWKKHDEKEKAYYEKYGIPGRRTDKQEAARKDEATRKKLADEIDMLEKKAWDADQKGWDFWNKQVNSFVTDQMSKYQNVKYSSLLDANLQDMGVGPTKNAAKWLKDTYGIDDLSYESSNYYDDNYER